jgi:thioredoxin 1
MAENYIELTHENFTEQVLQSSRLVIVNFSTEQSAACQIQEPEFVALSNEYQDRVTFAKLNVDCHAELTRDLKVTGIPTLIFFKGGQEIYRIPGVMMRNRLRRQIEGVLLAANNA